jgi:UDP-N-acetylglucosamine:LPS N-acetylglucosamine transferase
VSKNMPKPLKICVACCPGGHMVQAKQLASVYEKYDHVYVTFAGGVADEMKKSTKVRTVPDLVRRNPFSWVAVVACCCHAAVVERPDVVISTGAGAVVFFCVFAKLLGAKLIFLESMAKVKRPTWTARVLYPFADLFMVQWPGLLKFFPRAKFLGRLF